MADNMFVQPIVDFGGKRKVTVLMSMVVHSLVVASAIIVPLVATDVITLHTRFVTVASYTAPPLPPSLPQRRGLAREQPPVARPTFPVDPPPAIIAESPIQPTSQPDFEYIAGIVPGGDYAAPPPPPPPPAPVQEQAPVPLGGNIKRPLKVSDAAPAYPAIARAARVEGFVIVEATIGTTGKVQGARILRSIPLLDAAALDAVRQWEYTPTLLNGIPIAIVMTVTVDFRLR